MADNVQNIIVRYRSDIRDLQAGLASITKDVTALQEENKKLTDDLEKGAKAAGSSYDEVGRKTDLLGGQLKKLSKITSVAFAAKAVFDFAKALIEVSLQSDNLAPKVRTLKKDYREFLEVLAGATGIEGALNRLITNSSKLLTGLSAIVSSSQLNNWQKLKALMLDIKIGVDGIDLTGVTKGLVEANKETREIEKTYISLRKELSELRAQAKDQIIKEGQVRVRTAGQIIIKERELLKIEESLAKATEDLSKKKIEKDKITVKALKEEDGAYAALLKTISDLDIKIKDEFIETGTINRDLIREQKQATEELNAALLAQADAMNGIIELAPIYEEGTVKSADANEKLRGKIVEASNADIEKIATAEENIRAFQDVTSSFTSSITSIYKIAGADAQELSDLQKGLAFIQIGVNSAIGIAAATAQGAAAGPPPANIAAIAAGVAAVLASIAQAYAVINAAEGIIDIQGPGTTKSDSIPANLSLHESVMTAEETLTHGDALRAIRAKRFDSYIIDNYLPKLMETQSNIGNSFAENVSNSLQMLGYDDARLRDTIKYGQKIADRNTSRVVNAILRATKSNRRGV